ncbi:MAG: MBL fold metallo-hydrolase [Clostridia bacterium]|nr:MBL fold metallo-hydrolase [Clostridia bacterium]
MKTFPVWEGGYASMCYLVTDDKHECGVLIDPSVSLAAVRGVIGELPKIEALLLTHGHFDHMLALSDWKEETGAPVCICAEDAAHLTNASLNCHSLFFGTDAIYPSADRILREGDEILFGDEKLTVIQTPGHTAGSCLYYGKDVLFTGDTIMAEGGFGRYDLPGGSPSDLYRSLRKIFTLPLSLRIYPGHGRDSTLSDEIHFHSFK